MRLSLSVLKHGKRKCFSWVSLTAAKLQEAPFRFFRWFQHPVCRVSFLGDEPVDWPVNAYFFWKGWGWGGVLAESSEGMFGGDAAFMCKNLVMYSHYFVFLICSLLNQREFHPKCDLAGMGFFYYFFFPHVWQTVRFFSGHSQCSSATEIGFPIVIEVRL